MGNYAAQKAEPFVATDSGRECVGDFNFIGPARLRSALRGHLHRVYDPVAHAKFNPQATRVVVWFADHPNHKRLVILKVRRKNCG